MVRVETPNGWWLKRHQDHAQLAGVFAQHYGNALFTKPEPFAEIQTAVARHDDAWAVRDAEPLLTPEGLPSAFSRELVGTYAAFENIDLEEYLGVRGQATEIVAQDNPYAAIVISMHTVNLLTEQADLSTLSETDRALHAAFIQGQRDRQAQLAAGLAADARLAPATDRSVLQRAFEFLQAMDNLSLIVCVDLLQPTTLRHKHPTNDGEMVEFNVTPLGDLRFKVDPFPFDVDELVFEVPSRHVEGQTFELDAFRAAYAAAETQMLTCAVVK